MATTMVVNNLSVVHKESGGVSVAFPDVCKTPTSGGPVPIPYTNTARSADTAQASQTVKADGNAILLKSSNFSQSTGDEPGRVGGVVSGKIKGKAYPKMYSFDVKVEGENVVRNTDFMLQNGGSPTNTPPAPVMQANGNACPAKEAQVALPEVVSISLSKSVACCGDEITVKVEGKNAKDLPVALMALLEGDDEPEGSVWVKLKDDRGEGLWLLRRGPYQKTVRLLLTYRNPDGKIVKSSALEVKAMEPIAREVVGPTKRVTPQWKNNPKSGVLGPTHYNYTWQYCYQIELNLGELVVTRFVDLALQPGASAPSKVVKAQWKQEIESVWDKKWKFHRQECKRGNSCPCATSYACCSVALRIQVEFGAGPSPGVEKVKLFPGACDPNGWGKTDKWWYSNTWWEKADHVPAAVRAHEFGHLIGMYDEYPLGACDPARKYTNEAGSIMNAGSAVHERHVAEFGAWLEKKLKSEFGAMVTRPC